MENENCGQAERRCGFAWNLRTGINLDIITV